MTGAALFINALYTGAKIDSTDTYNNLRYGNKVRPDEKTKDRAKAKRKAKIAAQSKRRNRK